MWRPSEIFNEIKSQATVCCHKVLNHSIAIHCQTRILFTTHLVWCFSSTHDEKRNLTLPPPTLPNPTLVVLTDVMPQSRFERFLESTSALWLTVRTLQASSTKSLPSHGGHRGSRKSIPAYSLPATQHRISCWTNEPWAEWMSKVLRYKQHRVGSVALANLTICLCEQRLLCVRLCNGNRLSKAWKAFRKNDL